MNLPIEQILKDVEWCERVRPSDHVVMDVCCHVKALAAEVEAAPQWRDRPTGPGWWVWHCHALRHRIAVLLSQHDVDNWQDLDTFRVYGPIPDDPEEP